MKRRLRRRFKSFKLFKPFKPSALFDSGMTRASL